MKEKILIFTSFCLGALNSSANNVSTYVTPDEEAPSIFSGPTPIESGPSLDTRIGAQEWKATGPNAYGLQVAMRGFSIACPSIPSNFSISCLKSHNDFIVLDPGHDDTPQSMRSGGYLRRGDANRVHARPLLHEGKATMVSAWVTYELMKKCWAKNNADLKWIDENIRLSRYPGETRFGQYGLQAGRAPRAGGAIIFNADNRREWVNDLFAQNSVRRGLMASIHINSSGGVYDSVDMAWMIIPQNSNAGSKKLGAHFAEGLSKNMPQYFKPAFSDSTEVKALKNAVYPTYEVSRIRVAPPPGPLKMLSPDLGNAQTEKVLLEGFFMDGKAGNLVYRELQAQKATMFFKRGGRTVAGYHVSRLYLNYAQGVLAGLSRQCR